MSERWPMFANLRALLSRMRNSLRNTSLDRDLEAEMASHLQFAIEDNLKSGMSQQEARRQAQLTFGGPQQAKENHRDSRGLPFLDSVLQDLRFAFRLFRKAPSFSVSAILTLALGIGATTAIFSVVYGVLLRPLPYPQPDRIARLWEQGAAGNRMNFADPNFEDVRSQNKSLLAVAEYNSLVSTVAGSIEPARLNTASVSSDFFAVLGVHPVFGRSFAPDKQQFGDDTTMVAVAMEPLSNSITGNVRPALILLLGASSVLLLIACANVVNLALTQAAKRERELSTRAVLGAHRVRLVRQFLAEAFLLSSMGGALGVLLAHWGVDALLAFAPSNIPRLESVSIDK